MLPREGEFCGTRGVGEVAARLTQFQLSERNLFPKGTTHELTEPVFRKGGRGENYVLIFSYVHIYSGKVIEMK